MAEPAFLGQVWLRPTYIPFLVVAEANLPSWLRVKDSADKLAFLGLFSLTLKNVICFTLLIVW